MASQLTDDILDSSHSSPALITPTGDTPGPLALSVLHEVVDELGSEYESAVRVSTESGSQSVILFALSSMNSEYEDVLSWCQTRTPSDTGFWTSYCGGIDLDKRTALARSFPSIAPVTMSSWSTATSSSTLATTMDVRPKGKRVATAALSTHVLHSSQFSLVPTEIAHPTDTATDSQEPNITPLDLPLDVPLPTAMADMMEISSSWSAMGGPRATRADAISQYSMYTGMVAAVNKIQSFCNTRTPQNVEFYQSYCDPDAQGQQNTVDAKHVAAPEATNMQASSGTSAILSTVQSTVTKAIFQSVPDHHAFRT